MIELHATWPIIEEEKRLLDKAFIAVIKDLELWAWYVHDCRTAINAKGGTTSRPDAVTYYTNGGIMICL